MEEIIWEEIICKNCGSNNITVIDGVPTCSNCETKHPHLNKTDKHVPNSKTAQQIRFQRKGGWPGYIKHHWFIHMVILISLFFFIPLSLVLLYYSYEFKYKKWIRS